MAKNFEFYGSIRIKPTPKGSKYKLYDAWLKLSKLGHTFDAYLKLL